jgi:uncharacterized DUF497 family protein
VGRCEGNKQLGEAGISFGEATEVFYDPNALEGEDDKHSAREYRFFIIGYSANRLLYVVFAERHRDVIRIISARKPTSTERELYEERER